MPPIFGKRRLERSGEEFGLSEHASSTEPREEKPRDPLFMHDLFRKQFFLLWDAWAWRSRGDFPLTILVYVPVLSALLSYTVHAPSLRIFLRILSLTLGWSSHINKQFWKKVGGRRMHGGGGKPFFSSMLLFFFFVREREDIWIYVTSNEGGGGGRRKEREETPDHGKEGGEKNPLLLS